MTNTATASPASSAATIGATKILSFPVRANAGGWEKLRDLGALPIGDDVILHHDGTIQFVNGAFRFAEAAVPSGWEIRESGVSFFQKRLFDEGGKMIAKIFYKPTGGGGSLHVFLSDDDPMAAPDVIDGTR